VQKLSRYGGTLLFLWGVASMAGFFIARTDGDVELGRIFQKSLIYWVYVCLVAGGYMAAVGLYHTFLAVFGLDGEPGLFSRGKRTGPLSGTPEAPSSDPARPAA
jgi:hypothetical protein